MILHRNPGPPPILPKNLSSFRLLDIDPLEIARQLTIMDFELFKKIKPHELLEKSQGKKSIDTAPNVKAMINFTNQVSNWVQESILMQKNIKKRAAILKHYLLVAEKLHQLNNFNILNGITSAFTSSKIYRLKRTWEVNIYIFNFL